MKEVLSYNYTEERGNKIQKIKVLKYKKAFVKHLIQFHQKANAGSVTNQNKGYT